jgi:putative heme-binding domain-containing protein
LALATSEQLVAELANPNGWRRDTAQRLLVERQDHKATRSLRRMVRECEAPLARLHALWSLAGLDDLADDDILAGLNDPHPGIREHAIRLAESRLDGFRAIANRVRSLADDANIRVRLQVALSLGESPDPTVSDALTVIARRDGSDPWMRAAVLSSAMRCAGPLLIELLRGPNTSSQDDNPPGRLLHGLALIVGAHGSRSEIEQVLGRLADRAGHKAAPTIVVGLSEGLARSGKHLSRYVGSSSPAGELLAALLAEAQKTCRNPSADPDRRRAAIELLGVAADFDVVRDLFAQLLSSRQPPVIQSATIRALAGFDYADVSGILLANWSSYTPGTRSEVTEILLSRRLWIRPFLDAVAQGTVVAGQIAPARRERLTNDSDPEIRTIAQRLFNEIAPGPRAEALARFRPALALAGDARRGEKAFETAECINCHQIGKRGHPVGPNLATVQQRTPESLLEQILDPNREVLPNYLEYVVELDDGRVVTGIIVAETATSILLRRAQRNETAIARPSIQTIRSTGKSLMPEGLEQKLTVQDMADLLAFLAALHP